MLARRYWELFLLVRFGDLDEDEGSFAIGRWVADVVFWCCNFHGRDLGAGRAGKRDRVAG